MPASRACSRRSTWKSLTTAIGMPAAWIAASVGRDVRVDRVERRVAQQPVHRGGELVVEAGPLVVELVRGAVELGRAVLGRHRGADVVVAHGLAQAARPRASMSSPVQPGPVPRAPVGRARAGRGSRRGSGSSRTSRPGTCPWPPPLQAARRGPTELRRAGCRRSWSAGYVPSMTDIGVSDEFAHDFAWSVPSRLGTSAELRDGVMHGDIRSLPATLVHGAIRASAVVFLVDAVAGIAIDTDPEMWSFTSDLSVRLPAVPAPERILGWADVLRGAPVGDGGGSAPPPGGDDLGLGLVGFARVPRRDTDPPKPDIDRMGLAEVWSRITPLDVPLREAAGVRVLDAGRRGRARARARPPQPRRRAPGRDGRARRRGRGRGAGDRGDRRRRRSSPTSTSATSARPVRARSGPVPGSSARPPTARSRSTSSTSPSTSSSRPCHPAHAPATVP